MSKNKSFLSRNNHSEQNNNHSGFQSKAEQSSVRIKL